MKRRLEALWAKAGSITVADLGNEFFSVRFSSLEDLNLAITGGPWVILGHYLATRKWEPCFDPDKANIHKVAAWVRLPGIPQEYCEFPFLNHLGTVIGKVLKVDRTISTGDRARFARVCIEIDLAKPLKGEYILDGCRKRIEYEGLFLICLKCGRYGHTSESCPDFVETSPKDVPSETPHQSKDKPGLQGVGEWMVVQRKKKGTQGSQKKEVKNYRLFGADISNSKQEVCDHIGGSGGSGILKNVSGNMPEEEIGNILVNKENLPSVSNPPIIEGVMKFSAKASNSNKKSSGVKQGAPIPRKNSSKTMSAKGKWVLISSSPILVAENSRPFQTHIQQSSFAVLE
ncbi:uncharacterized protein LOC133294102 [Gastrolobium bilobum]|uniref:uncharacterized protein LOC133294102 n=1 Tax=Gastrolobium bilobum TaxID=150636 RepID=UPI002AB2AE04|nr:uncharacterized protein LOC133294102 [Gastrolobium bilobum]